MVTATTIAMPSFLILPTAEGAAVPPIRRNLLKGFRVFGDNKSSNDDNEAFDSDRDSSSLFRFRIGKPKENHRRNNHSQQQQQQLQKQLQKHKQNIAFPFWILASSRFGKGKEQQQLLGRINPKWILVGGAVYQTQKALRSEAIRRATRFWIKIGPVVAHYKFTRWWFNNNLRTNKSSSLSKRNEVYGKLHRRYAPITMRVALDLKGLYVKLAQVVSSRPDFVPLEYIELFVRAQDSLPQWPIAEIKQFIDGSLQKTSSSSSLSLEEVFESIDEIALGSASIGQCHKATIRGKYAREWLRKKDNKDGEEKEEEEIQQQDQNLPSVNVAIKVMHPGAEERFRHDFSVFRWLCKVALTGWEPILDELYRQIMSEFDYNREANSLATVRTNMIQSPFSNTVRVPKPLHELCSKELLVMELLEGPKLSDSLEEDLQSILGVELAKKLLDRKQLELVLGKKKLQALLLESESETGSSVGAETNTTRLLEDCGWVTKLRLLKLYKRAQNTIDTLVDVQGYQMLKDGIFQGDPHPGKIRFALIFIFAFAFVFVFVFAFVFAFVFVADFVEFTLRLFAYYYYFFTGNILELKKTKTQRGGMLGLIDYGQTKIITDEERLGVARVVLALGRETKDSGMDPEEHTEVVADAMRNLGFSTKHNDSKVLVQYACLFFDSDEIGKQLYDCPTPQTYFKILTELDPLVDVPDVAIFVARCGFILRGMGSILGKQIKTSQRWSVYAKQALEEAEQQHN